MVKGLVCGLTALTCFCLVLVSDACAENPSSQLAKGSTEQGQIAPAVKPVVTDAYVCPRTRYINCMPPVPKEKQAMCSRDYLDWAKSNCPGVKVVY
jgi:hypothetical protein